MAAMKTVTALTMCAAMAPLNAPRAAMTVTPPTMAMDVAQLVLVLEAAAIMLCSLFSSLAMMATLMPVVAATPIAQAQGAALPAATATNAWRPNFAMTGRPIAAGTVMPIAAGQA